MSDLLYISPSEKFREVLYGMRAMTLDYPNVCNKIGNYRITIALNEPTDLRGYFQHRQKVRLVIDNDGTLTDIYGITEKTKDNKITVRLLNRSYDAITPDSFNLVKVYTTPFFRWGDLKNGKIELNSNFNEFPLFFMISPNTIHIGNETQPFTYNNTDYNFIICDTYNRIAKNSEYDSFTERIANDICKHTGNLMFNFIDEIRNNPVFTNPSFSFNEQIPVGVSLRDNESGKTSKIFSQDVAGQMLTVNTGFDKEYKCNTNFWDDELFWSDSDYWQEGSGFNDSAVWDDSNFWNI